MNQRRVHILVAAVSGLLFVGANVVLFATGKFPVLDAGLPDWSRTFGLMAATLMTFAMYSMLYADNPVFRAAENLFVGLGVGVSVYIMWYQFLKPEVYDRLLVPVFNPAVEARKSDLVLIIPILLGMMMLARISRKYGWISRYPIAFLIGYGSGFGIQPTIHSLILKQAQGTMVPVQMSWMAWALCGAVAVAVMAGAYYASKGGRLALALKITAGAGALAYVVLRTTPLLVQKEAVELAFRGVDVLVMMLGVVSVLCYFFFSAEHKGALGAVSRVGIIFLMISFGASFGYTVMARESLVIGRFQFLLREWLGLM